MNLFSDKANRIYGICTICSVFLLILIGGIVRSTGAGMGCPDWPKCFGQYIPPSDQAHLPPDYLDIFLKKRVQKIEKFASLLEKLGMTEDAEAIRKDPTLYVPEPFNPVKARTEWINRLFGALTGLFAFLTLITGFRYLRRDKSKFFLLTAGVIMIIFNGWLGSIVVASNLLPGLVSIHYLAAYLAVIFLMLAVYKDDAFTAYAQVKPLKWPMVALTLLTAVQLSYGTRLRAQTDELLRQNTLYLDGNTNTDGMQPLFNYHWFMAIAVVLINILIAVYLYKKGIPRSIFRWFAIIPLTLLLQYVTGVLNIRLHFPVIPQVSHIFFGSVVFGIQMYICIALFRVKTLSNFDS